MHFYTAQELSEDISRAENVVATLHPKIRSTKLYTQVYDDLASSTGATEELRQRIFSLLNRYGAYETTHQINAAAAATLFGLVYENTKPVGMRFIAEFSTISEFNDALERTDQNLLDVETGICIVYQDGRTVTSMRKYND
jgi:hypothetical protein